MLGLEFVAGADPVDVGMRNDGVLYRKREIIWHTEDVGDADVLETAQDVHLRRRSKCRPRQPQDHHRETGASIPASPHTQSQEAKRPRM
ncbi:MAG: hypothetical protein QOD39_5118 [Mycobacterium sp.]|nr:hypothetical protein [Mycobacterium sp.]